MKNPISLQSTEYLLNGKSSSLVETPVVILAGGKGTRLGSLSSVIPKPMVAVSGRPIIMRIIDHYVSFGCQKFIIALGHKGSVIKDFSTIIGDISMTLKFTLVQEALVILILINTKILRSF